MRTEGVGESVTSSIRTSPSLTVEVYICVAKCIAHIIDSALLYHSVFGHRKADWTAKSDDADDGDKDIRIPPFATLNPPGLL